MEEYWSFTRGDPADHLAHNADALAMLSSLPPERGFKKIVFTNCAEKQAKEALDVLGLAAHFPGDGDVFGADAMGDVCKPETEAFQKIIEACGIDPKRTAFFEDSVWRIIRINKKSIT